MTAALLDLLYLACLAAIFFPWFVGWATLCERFADRGMEREKGRT